MNPNSLSILALAGNRDMNEWLRPHRFHPSDPEAFARVGRH